MAFGPYSRFAAACVATAPTPGMAYGTAAPAVKACDWTATPRSFVLGSNAMIENVANQRGGRAGSSTPTSGCWADAREEPVKRQRDSSATRFIESSALDLPGDIGPAASVSLSTRARPRTPPHARAHGICTADRGTPMG